MKTSYAFAMLLAFVVTVLLLSGCEMGGKRVVCVEGRDNNNTVILDRSAGVNVVTIKRNETYAFAYNDGRTEYVTLGKQHGLMRRCTLSRIPPN